MIDYRAKKINDITTLPKLNGIAALNKNDRLMILDFENNKQNFFQVRCGDESTLPQKAAHISSNGRCLLYSDGQERLFILSGSVIGKRNTNHYFLARREKHVSIKGFVGTAL